MQITSVEKNKKNAKRLSVYVDGEYSFYIMEEDYLRLSLYETREIDRQEIEDIMHSVNVRSARERAVKYLGSRLRSEKEVRIKLADEGYDDNTTNEAVGELKSIGYINDTMYAEKFVYDRSKMKPVSKKMLKYELQLKGISEEIISSVLEGWQIDDNSVIYSLIKRRFGKYDLDDEKVLKKVYSFLQHRGFSYDAINSVLKEIRLE